MSRVYRSMGRLALSVFDREMGLAANDLNVEVMEKLGETWFWLATDCSYLSRELGTGGVFE